MLRNISRADYETLHSSAAEQRERLCTDVYYDLRIVVCMLTILLCALAFFIRVLVFLYLLRYDNILIK